MTDSEKILAILERMDTRLANVEQDVSGLKQEVSGLKQGQAELRRDYIDIKQHQAELRRDVIEVKRRQDDHGLILARMETTHGEKLTALFDGYYANADVLKRVEADAARIRAEIIDIRIRLVFQDDVTGKLRKAN